LHKKGHRKKIHRIELTSGKEVKMNPVTVSVGHEVNCALVFLDQNGNPMLTPVTPDSAPTWTDTPSPTGAFTLTQNGVTATDVANGVGTDTIAVALSVGGKAFSASVPVTCAAAPQVLTSVEIATTVV
jgi:hypothetical protein